jgi:hypothetical protein
MDIAARPFRSYEFIGPINHPCVVTFHNFDQTHEVNLDRLSRFRIVSEPEGWRLEFTEGSRNNAKRTTLWVNDHEVGSRDFFQAWLECPRRQHRLDIAGRPASKIEFEPTVLEQAVHFERTEGRRIIKKVMRDDVTVLTLNASPIGDRLAWWIQFAEKGGTNSVYVPDPFKTFRELRRQWPEFSR